MGHSKRQRGGKEAPSKSKALLSPSVPQSSTTASDSSTTTKRQRGGKESTKHHDSLPHTGRRRSRVYFSDVEGSSEDTSEDLSLSSSEETASSTDTTEVTECDTDHVAEEMRTRQLAKIPKKWRLQMSDIRRVCKNIDTSIFGDECVIWQGYITNRDKPRKGPNVNFFFQGKKVALHRILYSNYVSPLGDREFLKYTCRNRGICCNVTHLECHTYNRPRVSKGEKVAECSESTEVEESSESSEGDLVLRF